MLDLDVKLNEFLEKIELSESKIEKIRQGRDAIRNKIKSAYSEFGIKQPKFHIQGSYKMGTMIQTLPDIEYDIDDGVYLQNFKNLSKDDWDSVDEVHSTIYEILKNHTDDVEDKNPCVRVTYAKNYHIDLPIYIMNNDIAFLAHLENGWMESDPKALREWFINKIRDNGEDLRSVVKLTKAWKDYLNYDKEVIDFCGLAITILLSQNYIDNGLLIDSFILSLKEVLLELETNFECVKPVAPNDDLFGNHSKKQKASIISEIGKLKDKLIEATNSINEKEACDVLKGVFGERFPSGRENITNQKFVKTKAPEIINSDARSA